MPAEHSSIAKKLEYALNTDVVIKDPKKVEFFKLREIEKSEYKTIEPGVIAQPDFQYLPAFAKLNRLDDHRTAKDQLQKTKEIRAML